MADTKHYEFHSFHLNIGTGDGSIHLLAKVDSDSTIKPEVEQAILIDGGQFENEALPCIKEVIKLIQATYTLPAGNACLKFNRILVTHWDADHYYGLVAFLREEFQNAVAVASDKSDLNKIQLPFLRYESDGTPATILHAPYWFDWSEKKPAGRQSRDVKDPNGPVAAEPDKTVKNEFTGALTTTSEDVGTTTKKGKTVTVVTTTKVITSYPEQSGFLQADPAIDKATNPTGAAATDPKTYLKLDPDPGTKYRSRSEWPRVLVLVTGTANLLGINFLSGRGVSVPTASIKSVEELLERNAPDAGQPGMYCVAVNALVLGQDVDEEQAPPEKPKAPYGDNMALLDSGENDRSRPAKKNRASIACMVLWTSKRLSHYFAGDARWEVEKKICQWSKVRQASCMKLSHHGANNSTPLVMLDTFTPDSIVVSAGNVLFDHPSWEAVLLTDAWMRTRLSTSTRPPRMCVTNYARYLHRKNGEFDGRDKAKERLKTFTSVKPGKDRKPQSTTDKGRYVDKLREYYGKMAPPVADPWSEFWEMTDRLKVDKTPGPSVPSTQWNWLAACIERAWLGRLCEPLRPQDVGTHTGATGASSPPDAKVRCFHVRSVDGDGDGDVRILTGYVHALAPLPARTVAEIQPASAAVAAAGRTPASVRPAASASVVAGVSVVEVDPDAPLAKKPKKGKSEQSPSLQPIAEGPYRLRDGSDDAASTTSSNATTTTAAAASSSSTYYYVYSSHLAAQKASGTSDSSENSDNSDDSDNSNTSDDAHSTTLGAGSSLDNLVGSLHRGLVVLESKPTGDATVNVVSGDELASWFEASMAGVLAVSAPGDNGSDPVGAFILTMSGLPHGQDTGTATICFRSTATCLGLAFGSDQAALAPAPGIVDGATLLVLGLDPATSTRLSTPLRRLLAYANVTVPSLLSSLESTTATLDVAASASDTTPRANVVWLLPWLHYTTNLRLQFTATDGCRALNSLIASVLTGFSASSLNVIVRTTASWLPGPGSNDTSSDDETSDDNATIAAGLVLKTGSVALVAMCKVTVTVTEDGKETNVDVNFQAVAKLSNDSIQLTLLPTDDTDVLSTILGWLSNITGIQLSNLTELFTQKNLSDTITLRRVRVTLVPNPSYSSKLQLAAFAVDLQVSLTFGATDGGDAVVFLVSFCHTAGQKFGSIAGSLWCQPPAYAAPPHRKLLPEWEDFDDFHPSGAPPTAMDLKNLFPNHTLDWIPPEIPTVITRATITVSDDGLIFGGRIECGSDLGKGPSLRLGSLSLNASYQWSGDFELVLDVDVQLMPAPNANIDQDSADLRGQLRYDRYTKTWSVSSTLSNLNGAALYSLFDKQSRDCGALLLENVRIPWAELYYDHTPNGNQFHMIGTLLLGPLELDLLFEHNSSSNFTFAATLTASQPDGQPLATVGAIVGSVFGDASELPDFVANISLAAPMLSLRLEKIADCFLLSVSCAVDGVVLTYAQYRRQDWPVAATSKRIVKVSVHSLPSIPIPLVGDLSQPFDQLYYLWVQDKSGQNGDANPAGLTSDEVSLLNDMLDSDSLLYKDTKKGGSKPTDVVIGAGSHFVLVLNDLNAKPYVLLDYAFKAPPRSGNAKIQPAFSTAFDSYRDVYREDGESPPDGVRTLEGNNDASMTALQASSGALHISNIGFKYERGVLSILLDASLAIGPISLALLGFSLGVDLKHYTLWSLPDPEDIVVSLHGLAAGFSRPPIELAGLFEHYQDHSSDYYAGGAVIAARLYLFAAAGFYGTISQPSSDDGASQNTSDDGASQNTSDDSVSQKSSDDGEHGFISAFVFAKLDGPLIELEFGEISGITIGFGYNSSLKYPSPDQVPRFPFIASQDLRGKPSDVLQSLTGPKGDGWFFPKEHSYWLAAGLTVDTFQILSISAVAVVQWDDALKLSIFAVGLADIPGNAVSAVSGGVAAMASFAHIELGILATIDLAAGALQVEAELSPNSYVLDPNCHPTGGFALYYWFLPGKAHSGDWVFSIGGYHQAFDPPPWYPHPKSVGMTWSLGDNFRITGSSYFAITPNVCMAGGQLYGVLTLPIVTGYFDARADFLVKYAPFHFAADIEITAGIRHTTDQAVTSSDTIIELSVQLQLYGPPVGGRAHIDFLFWHIPFDFGPKKTSPNPTTLTDLYNLVLQLKGSDALPQGGTPPDNQAHRFSCQAGLIVQESASDTETKEDAAWKVRAMPFSFLLSCSIPIQSATIGSALTEWPTPVYAKPLQIASPSKLDSTMTVSLATVDDPKANLISTFCVERSTSMVPKALWGEYTTDTDPSISGNHINTLLNGSDPASIELMTGLLISAPDAIPSNDPTFDLEHTPPENLEADNSLPAPPAAQHTSWLPAEQSSSSSPSSQWERARNAWKYPHWMMPPAQPAVLQLWLSAFETAWAMPEQERNAFEDECGFGAMPETLYERFDSLYLEPPRVASGGLA